MNIGFVGLGRMGSNMARRLAEAGHSVAAYDVRSEAATALAETVANVRAVKSIEEAARDADLVGTSLPGPREVEAVVLGPGGLLDSMKAGATYIDLSSNSVSLVRRLNETLAAKGIGMLDTPVTGGVTGAANGTLAILVGGDKALFEKTKPTLLALGPEEKIFYCGAAGAGAICKLCNNISGIAQMLAVCEVLTLGVKAGVDLKTLVDVIGVGSGTSRWVTGGFQRNLFRGDHLTGLFFPVSLSAKDTHLAVELAREVGADVGMLEVCDRDGQMALAKGYGDLNFEAMCRVQEERTGVELRLRPEDLPPLQPRP
jgi:3-hydroxyisobutyrate dehydrogenase-like beta-hydroxyacid dehydrogenase